MMAANRGSRAGLVWAIIGGVVVLAGIVAIILSAALPRTADPSASTPPPGSTETIPPTGSDPGQAVVDDTVDARGWVPEPITTDPEVYIRAALAAASTFDTAKSTRDEWLSYLDSWFTPDTRYTSPDEQIDAMRTSQLELRQAVVLPESEWDSLAGEDGRVVGAATGDVSFTDVPDDSSGDMRIGTMDVTLTYTRAGGGEGEASYQETVRVSVQVLCGAGSVPVEGSAQRPGDCKVVRYFTEPLEP